MVNRITFAGLTMFFALFTGFQPATAPAQQPDLAQLAWMRGAWCDDARSDGSTVEEYWTSPRGGSMLGGSRTIKGDRMVFFEFLRIEKTKDGIVYLAQPRGRDATPFKMIAMTDAKVVFENPEHDFPTRIVYERAGDDTLKARIEGKRDGQDASVSWTYRRMK